MKKLILSFLVFPSVVFSQPDPEQKLNVPISSVVVYLEGAEVSHVKQVTVNPGRNKLIFTNISPNLISKSIQFTASGDVSILAVSDQVNYLSDAETNPRIKALRDSSETFEKQIQQIQYDLDAFQSEKKMILANQSIGGNEKGVPVAELKLAADFYRTRIKEINDQMMKLEARLEKTNEIYTKVQSQLSQVNAESYKPNAEITILLTAETKVVTNIQLRYIVTNAGWAPSYDLIAEDLTKPIDLKYRAKVFNNTYIDWTNVKLRLSTADPMQSAAKPQLDPWYLNFSSPRVAGSYSNVYNNSNQIYNAPSQSMNNYEMEKKAEEMDRQRAMEMAKQKGKQLTKNQQQIVEYEQIQVSELSAEFEIKNPYSIPADSRPYIVDVTSYNLPATFKHFSVPKIDRDVFMLARITGWEDLDLVEGPANVYFNGTYVGQSYIYTRSADDTLDLSFGRDNKVLVTRSKIKDFNKERYIGNSKKETYAFEMVVKNNRKAPITIDIEDQIPVSQQGEIVVESIEISKGEIESSTGKLTWSFSIPPGESKKIVLSYSVKYPRNKAVNMQRTKTKARAKF